MVWASSLVRLTDILPCFCIMGEKSHWPAELFSSGSNLGPDVNQSNQPKDGLGTLTMGLPLRPSPPPAPPLGWSLRRPLLLTATSCRPKTAGIPPLLKWQQKNRSLLRRTWHSTLCSSESSTWLFSAGDFQEGDSSCF